MSFTPQVITGTSAEGDYIYYNATVVNNTVETDQRKNDPELFFQDTRQNPLIKDSSKYVLSVDNFTINGAQKNIPLWIPQIQPNAVLQASRTITATSGTGTVETFTTSTNHGLTAGNIVTVTGASPTAGYNATNATVLATPTPTTFTIAGTETGASSTAVLTYTTTTPDINRTIYTVTFGWQSTQVGSKRILVTIPLTWIPENLNNSVVVPTTATPRQVESPYYYGYTYDHFVTIFNNALVTAWRAVKTYVTSASPAGLGLTFGTKCPFLEFNTNTGLFSLCQDANTSWLPYGTQPRTSSQIYDGPRGESDYLEPYGSIFGVSADTGYGTGEFSFVGMNANLEGLITNFDTVYFGFQGTAFMAGTTTFAGVFYDQPSSVVIPPSAVPWTSTSSTVFGYYPEFVFNTIPDQLPGSIFQIQPPYTPTTVPTVNPFYIRDTQNYISTGTLWNPAASIVLVTSTIPVRFEGTAAPVQLGNSNAGGSTASTGASQKVLLETPINAITADMWRGFIDYKPLVPLFSALDPVHDGIINLDVRVCWRNRLTNELVPLRMYNSSSFTIRLRFVRKTA